jgi:uncharacterized protein (DUF111 family)
MALPQAMHLEECGGLPIIIDVVCWVAIIESLAILPLYIALQMPQSA